MQCCVLQNTPLGPGEDDLADVLEAVLDVAERWKLLGAALRIRLTELDRISATHPNGPTECLRDVLNAWLRQLYDTKKFGQPTWRLLCQAVHKRIGGNNPALARKIAEEHSKPKVVLFVVDYQYMLSPSITKAWFPCSLTAVQHYHMNHLVSARVSCDRGCRVPQSTHCTT